MLVIVDYGMGNLGSMQNMLKKLGYRSQISADPAEILSATKIILPGIGAFDQGMESLRDRGLIEALDTRVRREKVPLLGVCLGMQLLGHASEEGVLPGLGWVDAHAVRFVAPTDAPASLKVPHMGWNLVRPVRNDVLFEGFEADARFYFVHSYHMVCTATDIAIGQTHYGYDFVSVFRQQNIWGAQFHPEKSHRFGMQLLKNFMELT